jgi:hypothetical protein
MAKKEKPKVDYRIILSKDGGALIKTVDYSKETVEQVLEASEATQFMDSLKAAFPDVRFCTHFTITTN